MARTNRPLNHEKLIREAFDDSRPLGIREVRAAGASDLIHWVEITIQMITRREDIDRPVPKYLLQTRDRVKDELFARALGNG